ncbi:hypothetical protein ACIPVB_14060 [Microbacterium sp. NPDC090007]|uniref:hypothetical protein n=1 Tax=Microbacterium sp. NPDC090007 TaxID=3364204 RepID=UPI0038016C0A
MITAGLIRPYKRIPEIVEVFTEYEDAEASLTIVGRPASVAIGDDLHDRSKGDDRVSLRLDYVSDQELLSALASSDLVILNYEKFENSGIALMALSVGTPILLPRSASSEALLDEFGDALVSLFDGNLSAEDIRDALLASPSLLGDGNPPMPLREWPHIAGQYSRVYVGESVR